MLTVDTLPETKVGALLWRLASAEHVAETPKQSAADVEAEIMLMRDLVHAACGIERTE
jgi:hypothetical protein